MSEILEKDKLSRNYDLGEVVFAKHEELLFYVPAVIIRKERVGITEYNYYYKIRYFHKSTTWRCSKLELKKFEENYERSKKFYQNMDNTRARQTFSLALHRASNF